MKSNRLWFWRVIYCKTDQYISVCYVSSAWILPPLSISRPPLHLSSSSCNKQHEGGYNWEVQGSARWNHLYLNAGSRSLSRSLLYIVSLPLFLLLYALCFLSDNLPLSRIHSPIMCVTLSPLSTWCKKVVAMLSFYFSTILHSFSFHCCSLSVLKGTSEALPFKDVSPSFSFLFPVSPFSSKPKRILLPWSHFKSVLK